MWSSNEFRHTECYLCLGAEMWGYSNTRIHNSVANLPSLIPGICNLPCDFSLAFLRLCFFFLFSPFTTYFFLPSLQLLFPICLFQFYIFSSFLICPFLYTTVLLPFLSYFHVSYTSSLCPPPLYCIYFLCYSHFSYPRSLLIFRWHFCYLQNFRVSELLDYTAEELTGKNLYALCHGEDANKLRKSHVDRKLLYANQTSHFHPTLCQSFLCIKLKNE